MAREDGRPPVFVPLIQREIRLLVVLSIAAAALFGATRSLAGWVKAVNAQAAAEFFERGQQAAVRGDSDAAVAALRRAVAADRSASDYILALARALAARGSRDEASRLLLRLREAHPDDAEVNYWLARIAAADGSLPAAIRYYNHAMYGTVGARSRFDLRAELIGLLLDSGETERANAELAALVRETPDTADAHQQAASLAERAGNPRLAYAEYSRAATLDSGRSAAFAGAGRAAMQLTDFAAAERAFDSAIRLGQRDDRTLALADRVHRVRAADPLAPRLRLGERIRRATAGAAWALGRLSACAGTPAAPAPTDALRSDLGRAVRGHRLRDADDVASIIASIEQVVAATSTCPIADPALDVWRLIGDAHREGSS